MKERVTITIDEEMLKRILGILKKKKIYRNRSHLIEIAIEKFVEEEGKEK